MLADKHTIYSKNLERGIDIRIHGHYGVAILMFPAFTDSSSECEENGLVESISHFVKKGKCRIFSIDTVNNECWLHPTKSNEEKSKRHYEFNNFIIEELVHEIYNHCGGPIPILTVGADFGAYHAANTYFRRPDIFLGCIAMSGFYNIEYLTKGFFDTNCYFNSPVHYLPNLNDNYWLTFLMSKKHTYLMSGSGENENVNNTLHLSDILRMKNIPQNLDIWGKEWHHEWKTWNAQLPIILENKL